MPLQPQRAGRLLLALAGNALALDLRAGDIDYRLRGTPQLVLDDVTAQRPGDAVALLEPLAGIPEHGGARGVAGQPVVRHAVRRNILLADLLAPVRLLQQRRTHRRLRQCQHDRRLGR